VISTDLKLIAIHDKLDKKINTLQLKHGVDGAEGDRGATGDQGKKGAQGDQGASGTKGDRGATGDQGKKGDQGDQGVSVTEATVDLDNHLVFKLSDGNEIDAGEVAGGSGGDQYFRSGSKVTVNNDNLKDFKNPVFTYTGDNITLITYKTSAGVTTATKTFTYAGGVISQLVEVSSTGTITKLYHYTDGVLTRISEASS